MQDKDSESEDLVPNEDSSTSLLSFTPDRMYSKDDRTDYDMKNFVDG